MLTKCARNLFLFISLSIPSAHSDYEAIIKQLTYDDAGFQWSPGAYSVLNLMVKETINCNCCLTTYFNYMLENNIRSIRIWRLYKHVSNQSLPHFLDLLKHAMAGYITLEILRQAGDLDRHDIKQNFEELPDIHLVPYCSGNAGFASDTDNETMAPER